MPRSRPSRRPSSSAAAASSAGLLALAVAMGIGRFAYTPILPAMAAALGWTAFTAGLLASANFAGYLAGALLAALRLPGPPRRWLLLGLFSSAMTTTAMAATDSVPLFLALRFLGGVASAVVLVLGSALVLEALAAAGRPRLAWVLFAGVGAGIVLSAVLVAGLEAAGRGWAELWLANGAASLAGAACVPLLLPAPGASRQAAPRTAERFSPALMRLIGAYGLFGFGYVITATFIVAMVRADPGLRSLELIIWIAFGIAAMPSVALWTGAAGRIGPDRAYAMACAVEATGVACGVLWDSAAGLLLAAFLVGGTFMGLTALGLMRARALAGGDGSRAMALMTSAFGLGQMIGPSFAGALHDRLGSFTAPSLAAAAALVVGGILAILNASPRAAAG